MLADYAHPSVPNSSDATQRSEWVEACDEKAYPPDISLYHHTSQYSLPLKQYQRHNAVYYASEVYESKHHPLQKDVSYDNHCNQCVHYCLGTLYLRRDGDLLDEVHN